MEVGAGRPAVKIFLVLLCCMAGALHQIPSGDISWRLGIAETSAARTEELPAADMLEQMIKHAVHTFDVRYLGDGEADELMKRLIREQLAAAYKDHHKAVARRNDAFLSQGTVSPQPAVPSASVFEVPDTVPLTIIYTGRELPFGESGEAYLQAREHRSDMILASEVFTVSGVQYLHIYVYRQHDRTMETVFIKPFEPAVPLEFEEVFRALIPVSAGPDAGAVLVSSPVFTDLRINGTPALMGTPVVIPSGEVRVEAGGQVHELQVLPGEITQLTITGTPIEQERALVRTLPPSVESPHTEQFAHPLLAAYTRPGYLSFYAAAYAKDQDVFIEKELVPAWHQEIYSREMRGDQFYRSLGGFMLTLPAAAVSHGLRRELSGDDTDIWDLLFYGTAAAVLTRAGMAIQSLVRYTK